MEFSKSLETLNETSNWFFVIIIILLSLILFLILLPFIVNFFIKLFVKSSYHNLGKSSKVRLIHELKEAIQELSNTKVGAIITLVQKDSLDKFRTDGIKINANLSADLIIALFQKNSPLHDGAIIIENNIITYASTFYTITSKSISNRYGARHRASLGISENTDSLTIVVSETNGEVSFAIEGKIFTIKMDDFQNKLTNYLK